MAKTVDELVQEVSTEIKSFKETTAKDVSDHKTKLAEIEGKLKGLDSLASSEALEQTKKSLQDQFDELATKFNEGGSGAGKNKSFDQVFGEAINAKHAELAGYAKTKSKLDLSLELKAVGDMNIGNFGTGAYEMITTERRQGVYQGPFSPLWLRNILPNTSTDGATIQYLRENGGEGAAAKWTEAASGNPLKPQVDFDFELVTETVDWIAGITRIPRSMLEDAAFLRGYIPNQLIYGRRGLFVAENAIISQTLADNSVTYDGGKTIDVERIYDAALGQIRDNYFQASHILMNNRDAVDIALNKADTSGLYNLPPGTVVMVNGQLYIGGIPVIGIPQFTAGTFTVLDNRATQFVSRMSTETRFFEEDRDNVPKNLITIRAEERVGVLVFDENAIITGTL